MRPLLIRKSPVDSLSLAPGSEFSWPQVGHDLGLSADGHLNIAALAVDRHAHSARADIDDLHAGGQVHGWALEGLENAPHAAKSV